ncbi:MAG: DeoR/GlpR transcriptional regulator [Verrucomicrobia bacterium]|nr:DeoR/GlpR transcriptional regulator [Verrucomicrobiota bacterium]
MKAPERQRRIEALLGQHEFADLATLARELQASESTVRRDLDQLAAKGVLKRTHGGAMTVEHKTEELNFLVRDTRQADEKDLIGRAAAALVQDGMAVIVDGGTTTYHVAKHLGGKRIQVVTNSLPAANLFINSSSVETIVTGGFIYPRLGVLLGPVAEECLSTVHADIAIMSCGGVTPEGFTNSNNLIVAVQLKMMAVASRVVLCIDHTKFGRRALSPFAPLEKVHTVITDKATSRSQIAMLQKHGVEVIVAKG